MGMRIIACAIIAFLLTISIYKPLYASSDPIMRRVGEVQDIPWDELTPDHPAYEIIRRQFGIGEGEDLMTVMVEQMNELIEEDRERRAEESRQRWLDRHRFEQRLLGWVIIALIPVAIVLTIREKLSAKRQGKE